MQGTSSPLFVFLKKLQKKIIINCSLSFDEDDSNRQHKKEESKKFIAWHTDFHHSSSTNFFLVSHLNWEKFSFLFYVIFLILLRHKKVRAHDAHNEQEIFPLTMDGVFFMLALKKRKNIEEEKNCLIMPRRAGTTTKYESEEMNYLIISYQWNLWAI